MTAKTAPAERDARLDILATGVDCPRCGAYADTSCRTGTGRPTAPHATRIDRAVRLYERTGVVLPVAHTIRNDEIGLSYCGRLLPIQEPTDATPWTVSPSETAIWDDDETPAGQRRCPDCWTAYDAACAEIDARLRAADEARTIGLPSARRAAPAPAPEAPAEALPEAPAVEVVRGACGTARHWTVVSDGVQVACRPTRRDALAYGPDEAAAPEAPAPEGGPCAVCGAPVVEVAPDRWLHASTVRTAVPEGHAAAPAAGDLPEALRAVWTPELEDILRDRAETIARATGSVGATVREERRELDGSLTVVAEATWTPALPEPSWCSRCPRASVAVVLAEDGDVPYGACADHVWTVAVERAGGPVVGPVVVWPLPLWLGDRAND